MGCSMEGTAGCVLRRDTKRGHSRMGSRNWTCAGGKGERDRKVPRPRWPGHPPPHCACPSISVPSYLLKPDLCHRAPRSPRPPAAREDSAGFGNAALGAGPASAKRRSQGANDHLERSRDLLGLKIFPIPRLSPQRCPRNKQVSKEEMSFRQRSKPGPLARKQFKDESEGVSM